MARSGSWLLLATAATALLSRCALVDGLRPGLADSSDAVRLRHGQNAQKPGKKKHHGKHHKHHHKHHHEKETEEELKLPAILLSDVQRQDRDLGDATHMLARIGRLTSDLASVGVALGDLDPDFITEVSEIAPSGADMKQKLRLQRVVACGDEPGNRFVTFNGAFEGRPGFTTVRLDSRGIGQIYASVMGEFSEPLSDHDRWDDNIPGGGDPVKLLDLKGVEADWSSYLGMGTTLLFQHVFDRLMNICHQSGAPPQLEVELHWASARSGHLVAYPNKLEDLQTTVINYLDESSPLLQVHVAAKEMLSSLLKARYAWHPAFALELEADLPAVRRKLGEAMGRLDGAVGATKELVETLKGKMEDVVSTANSGLGGSTRLGRRLREEAPEEWHPDVVGEHVGNARHELEEIWAKIAFASAPLASAYARTMRLITPGAPVGVEEEDPLRPNITSLGSDTREEDYDFLRAFVTADLVARSDIVEELWERFNAAGEMVREAIWMAAHADADWDPRNKQQKVSALQRSLRSHGAFGYPALLHVAETTTDKYKAEWARQWSALRSSLDFTVWPAGSEAAKMVMPRICQSTYQHMGSDDMARFPGWMGGHAITHEFMIFAGGELPDRTHCRELLNKLVRDFPRDEGARTQHPFWSAEYEQVARLGCLGYEHWSQTGGEIYHDMQDSLRQLGNITLRIKLPVWGGELAAPALANGMETYEVKEVTVNADKGQESRKHRRGHRTRHMSRGLAGALVRYMTHTVTKYSSKSGGDFMEGAKASLQRNPPFLSPEQLSNQFWDQLSQQGVPSPFEPERCRMEDGEYECDDWNTSVPGYWYEARIAGDTLEAALATLEATFEKRRPGDWAPIAQTPATYAAVGFDSAGVVDNGDWDCENTTQVCEVHPKCGRIASQMLQYPFAGNKKYASKWGDKIVTYAQAAESGFFAKLNNFYFDSDGYHGYCHSPGRAYCWSYTACLREMLKWLCAQPETSEQCCPSVEVRDACQKDVNGEGCEVCWDAIQPDQEFDESVDYIYEGGIDNETLDFIHPDATDLAERQEVADQKVAAETCEVCGFLKEKKEDDREWVFISTDGACAKHQEICAEVCGFDQPIDEIDDWDTCKKDALERACEACE